MSSPATRRFLAFNKQLICGEIGALIGTPSFPAVASLFTRNADILSASAVVGALVAGSVFWVVMKIRDERQQGTSSLSRLAGQIAWFSPAAFVSGLLTYQPVLFLAGRAFIRMGVPVVPAVLAAQALAFCLFLLAMNGYRLAVHRSTGQWI